jgi:protein O-GlcNAc transferase
MNATDLKPLFIQAVAEHQAGRLSAAQAIYDRILKLHPNHPDALHLLGVTFHQQGDQVRAIHLIEKAIGIRGGVPDYHGNLALAYDAAERFPEAAAASRKALELNPRFADAANTLGMALLRLGEPESAAEAFKRALEINPDHIEALGNLATAHRDEGLIDEALAGYREVLRRRPERAKVHSNLIYVMHLHPDYDDKAIRRELDEWDRMHGGGGHGVRSEEDAPTPSCGNYLRTRGGERRGEGLGSRKPLRVGLVSPDFRSHVVGNNLLPVLREINREDVEIVGYRSGGYPDEVTAALKACMTGWRDIARMPDGEAAALIRGDRIDILVDLSLHSAGNRLTLFAIKPAPVQISYLGYCGSSGLAAMDFRLSDPFIDPPTAGVGDNDFTAYSERTLYVLPYLCYRPLGALPEVNPLPALVNGYVTFGCLNNPAKVSAAALKLWIDIVRKVPGSRLLLHAHPGRFRSFCQSRFAEADLDVSRLEFVGRQGWPGYIAGFQKIDIALDPFPYCGGVSTCDALSMGVPVVTLLGRTAVGRLSGSLLRHAGLEDGIARSAGEYFQIAVGLANDLRKLGEIRQSLRARVERSPIMDARQMAGSLVAAFQKAWEIA